LQDANTIKLILAPMVFLQRVKPSVQALDLGSKPIMFGRADCEHEPVLAIAPASGRVSKRIVDLRVSFLCESFVFLIFLVWRQLARHRPTRSATAATFVPTPALIALETNCLRIKVEQHVLHHKRGTDARADSALR